MRHRESSKDLHYKLSRHIYISSSSACMTASRAIERRVTYIQQERNIMTETRASIAGSPHLGNTITPVSSLCVLGRSKTQIVYTKCLN